ncbi:ATP-binding protein [Bradyrhizobium sp. SSUT112]|uniref:AAA family ATPase n=1 Tax=Bradyrhizobium sp. SSUT112 TaxID=3040604 RepID=UPI00244853E5|nr:ATP-binding protein [Bradyrhizobium sp. SSUT112]MDH2356677.1 ATP-binding protein [Bradyrhizobium sp. SSUT112]
MIQEFCRADDIRRSGLPVRSKLLFCGPPGCGKTLCTEIFAGELGLPLFVVKIDRLISSYLGETATNIRKIFEFARKQPCVLFLDEFDALARSRDDTSEHNELRRVVNSLLIFIDRIKLKGFLVAATNLDQSLDAAIWRRFDEVIWFEKSDREMIEQFLALKFKNIRIAFDPVSQAGSLEAYSFAEIERICVQAIKAAVIERRKEARELDFRHAVADEIRRRSGTARRIWKTNPACRATTTSSYCGFPSVSNGGSMGDEVLPLHETSADIAGSFALSSTPRSQSSNAVAARSSSTRRSFCASA